MVDRVDISSVAHWTDGTIEGAAAGRRRDDPAKIREAAQKFEALLVAQMLRTARESEGTWLGSGQGDCATELAEQHLAESIAAGGGLHLADLIAEGLKK
jgi:peptidoglycan hydrolase FlgJ